MGGFALLGTLALTVHAGGMALDTRTLSAETPEITLPLQLLDLAAGGRFLRVDVDEVRNPEAYSVSVAVLHAPAGEAPKTLGHFALFPPDQPGQFIVPAPKSPDVAGRLILSLDVPAGESVPESLSLRVRSITLTNRHPAAEPVSRAGTAAD